MKILVGSENPVKINCTKVAFEKFFENVEVLPFSVPSSVADQPKNEETFEGAKNRVDALKMINDKQNLNADFFVGIEGGITQLYGKWFVTGIMCIMNSSGKIGFGTAPWFELLEVMYKEIEAGLELGSVTNKYLGE
ncbi:inosine/xanthosine triphosphatase [Candidatus Woesearchaeota archaeon CG10_big_fil_rev_8_21_14_0_10_37_12]|nr:MAG: inosine/xanthosine triphosphatase [Candidatus Woesearchaeota archaeon CG10_big_fil_rev_8_21_14_0_10_37_12]